MRPTTAFAAILVPIILLAGCNTTKGVGRDVESVGKTIEKAGD